MNIIQYIHTYNRVEMGENTSSSSAIAEVVPKATFVENVQAYVKGTVCTLLMTQLLVY